MPALGQSLWDDIATFGRATVAAPTILAYKGLSYAGLAPKIPDDQFNASAEAFIKGEPAKSFSINPAASAANRVQAAVAPAAQAVPPPPDPLAVANQNTKRAIADLLTGQRDRLEAARQKNPYTQQGAYYDTQMQKATLGGLAHGRGLIRNLISRGKYGTGIGDAQVDRADTDLAAGLMQLKGNLGAQEANYDLGIVDRLTANDAARVAAEGGYFDRAFDIAKFGEGQRQFNVTTEQQAKQFAERMGYQWEALRAEQKAAFIQAIASIFGEAGRAVLPGFAKKQGWIA